MWLVIVALLLLILFLLWLYMIKPDNSNKKAADFAGVEYAHRGLRGDGAPENSLKAFRRAAEQGFGVELDIQFTKDKRLAVFHDENIKRMCGVDKKLMDIDSSELGNYPLAGSGETIPLFEDVLELLGETKIICEIKFYSGLHNYEICEAAAKLIEGKENICIESFNPYIVGWFRRNEPERVRGQLGENLFRKRYGSSFGSAFLISSLVANYESRPNFMAWGVRDSRFIPYRIFRAIYKPLCVAWTVKRGENRLDKNLYDAEIFE